MIFLFLCNIYFVEKYNQNIVNDVEIEVMEYFTKFVGTYNI